MRILKLSILWIGAAIIKAKDLVKSWQRGYDSLIELGKELGFDIPE